MSRIVHISVLLFSFVSAVACAQDLTPQAHAEIDRRISFHRHWSEESNSKGAKLILKEIARGKVGEPIVVVYQMFISGTPLDQEYTIFTAPTMASSIDDIQIVGDPVHIAPDASAADRDNTTRQIFVMDPAPGEPYRFGVMSRNEAHKAFITVVPLPIESTDRGCKLSVVRLTKYFELAFLQAENFPPNVDVSFHSDSAGEVHDVVLKTNDKGYADGAILAVVKGKNKGKMVIQSALSACSPKVSFNWGSTD